jgi:hypothetical protein
LVRDCVRAVENAQGHLINFRGRQEPPGVEPPIPQDENGGFQLTLGRETGCYYRLFDNDAANTFRVRPPGPAATAAGCRERRGALVIRMPLSRDGEGCDGGRARGRSGVRAQKDHSDGHIIMRHNQINEGAEISIRVTGTAVPFEVMLPFRPLRFGRGGSPLGADVKSRRIRYDWHPLRRNVSVPQRMS